MKCIKCGSDVLEGDICENCKNLEVIQSNVVQKPQNYDPVADLMNEPVVGTVSLEKNEMESAIPLGDSLNIPEVPVNENVSNVAPAVQAETPSVVEEVNKVENTNETIQNEVSGEVNTNEQTPVVTEKKKKNVVLVIAIVLGIIVVLGGALLFLLNYFSVINLFHEANVNSFVTEVQYHMEAVSSQFIDEALKPDNIGRTLIFSNDTKEGAIPLAIETDKNYEIVLNRNGDITSIILYDDDFCYHAFSEFISDDIINKTTVVYTDVLFHSKEDNLTDGCKGEKYN